MFYRYTDKEMKEILKSINILIDTREQENKHVIDSFDKNKIPWRNQKLDIGDYSCFVPENEGLGISRPFYFDKVLSIERKNSLEELSGNIAQDRQRFEDELLRSGKTQFVLMIEKGSFEDILNGNYSTGLKAKSFYASLMTFKFRYGIDINFVSRSFSGDFIYSTFYYKLRELLKEGLI